MKWFGIAALAAVLFALVSVFDANVVHAASASVGLLPSIDTNGLMQLAAMGMVGRLTIQQKREKRDVLARGLNDLMEKTEGQQWSPENQKVYDDSMGEISNLDAAIKREQSVLDLAAEKAFKAAGGDEVDPVTATARAMYDKWMRGGDRALSAEEWTQIRNTMSTTTGSEGGYTVQSDIAKVLIDQLKDYGGVREVAEIIRTATGNALNFPTSNGTSEVGELVAENAAASDADASFGTVGLNVFRFSSKVITVPIELLQDSSIDIEAFVNARLAQRLGRATNAYYTTGTGTNQPRGIVTGSTAGKVGASGQVTTVLYNDLVDLQHSVNRAYRKLGAGWMFADLTLASIRKIKDDQARPIFVPGYETGNPGGMPDRLLGDPIAINDDVPVMAASAKSILYGHMKAYKVRDALDVMLMRFTDSAYAKNGQVGFLAFMRSGGNLVDTAAVKHYVNAAS